MNSQNNILHGKIAVNRLLALVLAPLLLLAACERKTEAPTAPAVYHPGD
jgi:hypothetical protein